MWAQQAEQEVVYEWVHWLQSSMLSHLGFDNGIVIRQPHTAVGPVDLRVVGEILSAESVVQQLIGYNEEQCHESFLHGLHACMICFSEYPGNLNVLVDARGTLPGAHFLHYALHYDISIFFV